MQEDMQMGQSDVIVFLGNKILGILHLHCWIPYSRQCIVSALHAMSRLAIVGLQFSSAIFWTGWNLLRSFNILSNGFHHVIAISFGMGVRTLQAFSSIHSRESNAQCIQQSVTCAHHVQQHTVYTTRHVWCDPAVCLAGVFRISSYLLYKIESSTYTEVPACLCCWIWLVDLMGNLEVLRREGN